MRAIDNAAIAAAAARRFRSEYDYAVFEYLRSAKVIQALERAGVRVHGRVLDSGCGGGGTALSLAQEPEPTYYNRIYNEYIQARQQVGESVAGISYENFVTKLRFNESNLKSTYQCSAVRFRVVVKDDKVTLKPVPIV